MKEQEDGFFDPLSNKVPEELFPTSPCPRAADCCVAACATTEDDSTGFSPTTRARSRFIFFSHSVRGDFVASFGAFARGGIL